MTYVDIWWQFFFIIYQDFPWEKKHGAPLLQTVLAGFWSDGKFREHFGLPWVAGNKDFMDLGNLFLTTNPPGWSP